MVHHTVRGTYGTPEAGTCTAYVAHQLPCASGTYSTREAVTRTEARPGSYVLARRPTHHPNPNPNPNPVSTAPD